MKGKCRKEMKEKQTDKHIQILISTANSFRTKTQLKRAYTNYYNINQDEEEEEEEEETDEEKPIADLLLLLSLLQFYFA